jgi:hypothetical protein
MNQIKIQWLIPLLTVLALFRPSSGLAWEYTNNFSWLELIPPGYWLDSWSFEDGSNWDSDFGFAPLSYSNIVQVPDWDGNAMQVDTTNAAYLTYAITENAPGYGEYTNLSLHTGSIEFMFVPNWQSADTNYFGNGPGDWGRFIDIGTWDTNADKDWWSLYLNPSGTSIYFSSGTNGVRTNYLNAPILWDGSTWHQIVLTYGPTNSFLYLDGQLAASGTGVCYMPSGDGLTNGFAIGSDFATGLQQIHGQIDDLYIYNYQLNSNDVASDYADISPELPGSFHAMDDSPPFPGEGGGGGGSIPGDDFSYSPNYGTNLWIQQFGISSNYFTGILSNTLADVEYQLLFENTLGAQWEPVPNGVVVGSESTNWTPWSVPFEPTTNFFLSALSYQDDSETGIPDWWWLKYFGQDTNLDAFSAFADPAGDGWTLLQDYQNGWIPTNWVTPPAPEGLTVISYNSISNWATLTWLPSSGAVTNYTLQTPSGNVNISPSSDSYVDQSSSSYATYTIQANYAEGNSAWSAEANVPANQNTLSANIIGGPIGSAYLAVTAMPTNTASLQLSLIDFDGVITNLTIPVSNPTNGLYSIPNFELPVQNYDQFWTATAEDTNGNPVSSWVGVGAGYFPQENYYATAWVVPPYFDGRTAMKQNLIFLLRAANENSPIEFNYATPWEEPYQSVYSYPTNYVCEGFYDILYPYDFDVFEPFEENYLYLNFAFNPNNVDSSGEITSGPAGDSFPIGMNEPTTYQFTYPTVNDTAISAVLSTSDTQWLCSYPPDANDYSEMGIGMSYDGDYNLYFSMTNDVVNYFGLPFTSAAIAWGSGSGNYTALNAGGTVENVNGYFYPATALPKFQILAYNFWQNPGLGSWPYAESAYTTNVPGTSGFSTFYTNSLMIASVGDPRFQVVCYAKMEVTNSIYSGVYAYLGQYFTNAYQIDSSGNVTTNPAGMLSPYGAFFATVPGPAALLTMPDIDSGLQGTGVVNCISLQVDKNHDGTMDLNFFGQDTTSQGSPMEFWKNDGCDVMGVNGNYDQDLAPPATPNYTLNKITCQRDLENFARLWVCGLPAALTNGDYYATISCTAITGSPAINLYYAETNGGIGYLTDTNIASSLVGEPAIGTVSATNSFIIPFWLYNGSNLNFLFEGAGIGEGQFTLTVYRGTNAIAQTSVFIDLHEMKDFFEHPRASDVSLDDPPTTNSGAYVVDSYATVNNPAEDKEIVIYVHGLNNSPFDYEDSAQTICKRLYWQGYHGRYAAFRWPCPTWSLWPTSTNQITLFDYDKGEYISWQSGAALKNYIDSLHVRYPDYVVNIMTVSEGGITANDAVRLGAQVDNLVLSKVTVPAEACDGNNSSLIYSYLASTAGNTPDADALGGYNNCFTNQCRRVNFYNDDDFACYSGALHLISWEQAQLDLRPDQYFVMGTIEVEYTFDGTNCYFTEQSQFSTITNRLLTQDYEKKSYVARSRTKALGAAGLKYTPYTLAGGVISTNISLQDASLGFVGGAQFNDTRPDHGGEFFKPIQNTTPFYYYLLQQGFQIQPKISP